ncbi:MAG: hypothetical protein JXB62_19445 [Pirellulales bacterium]|nr:hypothetical protein [Pirellulales bacterium]
MSRSIAPVCLLLLCGAVSGGNVTAHGAESGPAAESGPNAPSGLAETEQERLRGELGGLIEQLDSDRYELRRRAAVRLEALATRPEMGRLLATEFRRVLLRPETSFEVRWHLEQWCRRLPEVPLEPVEDVSPEQLDRLVRQVDDDSYGVRLGAVKRLQWLLCQDELLPRVRKTLEARLAEGANAETSAQLKALLDLTRPAMVAEYWRARRHEGEQHLLVGVPSMSEGALRPSHFDRIDDREAHCVSGNNLEPGDYPVGVAFPHPNQPTAFFHLVNLPTPQRRLDYRLHVQTDQAQRLTALSQRTFERMLTDKHKLSERELLMLAQLDPKEVSRFAGKYFLLLEDEPVPAAEPVATFLQQQSGGRPSRFGMICARLAMDGTEEAAPGLMEALAQGRFLPPTSAAPYRLGWLAALSIADRDPWGETDAWLAAQIGRDEILVEGRPDGPEVGATAAGLLLEHREQTPSFFGLQNVPDPWMLRMGVEGYRFVTPGARQKVRAWWERQQQKQQGL